METNDEPVSRTRLEDVFDLPSLREEAAEKAAESDETLSDPALERIRRDAVGAFRVLMDAGLGSEPRHAAQFLESAVKALEIALDAVKTARRNDIDREKIDVQRARIGAEEEEDVAPGIAIDRNELLDRLKEVVDGRSENVTDPDGKKTPS